MSVMNVVSAQREAVHGGGKYYTGKKKQQTAKPTAKPRPKYQSRKHNPYSETPTKSRGGY